MQFSTSCPRCSAWGAGASPPQRTRTILSALLSRPHRRSGTRVHPPGPRPRARGARAARPRGTPSLRRRRPPCSCL
eukprot:4953547-Pyramimonas_sp.AAC.1